MVLVAPTMAGHILLGPLFAFLWPDCLCRQGKQRQGQLLPAACASTGEQTKAEIHGSRSATATTAVVKGKMK